MKFDKTSKMTVYCKKLAVLSMVSAIVTIVSGNAFAQEAHEPKGMHCVAQVDPDGGSKGTSVTPTLVCFETFAEAILEATDGSVAAESDAEILAALDTVDEILSAGDTVSASSTVIGVDFAWQDYKTGGGTLTFTTTNPQGCYSGASYSWNTMPRGWDNGVGSARAYGGCDRFYHFEYSYHRGSVLRCYRCSRMGVMNLATSSVKFRSSGNIY